MISLVGFIMSSKLVTSQDLQFSFSQGLYSDWMKALILFLEMNNLAGGIFMSGGRLFQVLINS